MSAMMNAPADSTVEHWVAVCDLDDILPDTGVAALVDDHQIAIFRISNGVDGDAVYAVDNYDPYSSANVLSRGLVGDLGGELMVASPVYKNHFALLTGICLEDAAVVIRTYPVRVTNGRVEVQSLR